MRATRLATSFGSLCASFFLLVPVNKIRTRYVEIKEIVRTIHCNVAQRRRAVILHVGIWGVEEAYEDWYSSRIDKLLPVLIFAGVSI
jgi:hypothetical protein